MSETQTLTAIQMARRLGRLMREAHLDDSFPIQVEIVGGQKKQIAYQLKKVLAKINKTAGMYTFTAQHVKDDIWQIEQHEGTPPPIDFFPKLCGASESVVVGQSLRAVVEE